MTTQHEPNPVRLRETLARHGIRCTRQRQEIYAALAAVCTHPTAEELLRTVRRTQPGISLATVYNTLETFTRLGLCRKVATAGMGPCRYDADVSDHLHVIAPDGQVRDIPDDLGQAILEHIPRELIARVEQRMGVRVERMVVDLLLGTAEPAPKG